MHVAHHANVALNMYYLGSCEIHTPLSTNEGSCRSAACPADLRGRAVPSHLFYPCLPLEIGH